MKLAHKHPSFSYIIEKQVFLNLKRIFLTAYRVEKKAAISRGNILKNLCTRGLGREGGVISNLENLDIDQRKLNNSKKNSK